MRLTIRNLHKSDPEYYWRPCASAKIMEENSLIFVKSALGSYIEGMDGHRLIDGISSWWCKSLGHNHPRLKEALLQQANQFEHVIGASTIHEPIMELSKLLVTLNPGMGKVFYTGDGSSAVEVALKMSLHSHFNQGNTKKKNFLSLANGYHGETFGALSVTQTGHFKKGYASLLFKCLPINGIPYVNSTQDHLWQNCEEYWNNIQDYLEKHHHTITALILEPIVQGAGNMKIYSQDFLRRLRIWTKKYDIHLIADEIMTGIGRTGKMFACEHAKITPDFMCLSKGLTSGWLPFSAVLVTNEIYNCFYDKVGEDNVFYHSHTYSGNALGAALALETLKIMKDGFAWDDFKEKTTYLLQSLQEVADETKTLSNVRGIGMIAAADINKNLYSSDKMKNMIRFALQNGALLRPLGRTVYWLPPLNIEKHTIDELKEATKNALVYAFKQNTIRI